MTPPSELRVSKDRQTLKLVAASGEIREIPAELLRVKSPSAEVRGHGPGQRKLVAGKRDVRIANIVATGNYAVRISFDDGHDTGIFTWQYLAELAENTADMMRDYEAEIEQAGLSRFRV